MNNGYVIEPTDVVHGKEWKIHKYISRIFKNGKWSYKYPTTKTRGSAYSPKYKRTVTNKDGTPYNPSIKTLTSSDLKSIASKPSGYSAWYTNNRALLDTKLGSYATNDVDRIIQQMMVNGRKLTMTNNSKEYGSGVREQYTPSYKRTITNKNGAPYTPNIKTSGDGTMGEYQGHGTEKTEYGTRTYNQYNTMNTKRKKKK